MAFSGTSLEILRSFDRRAFAKGPPTTHHPHKRPSSSGGIWGGVVCELSEPKQRQNTHHLQSCTRDVDRRFCVGGAWTSWSDVAPFLETIFCESLGGSQTSPYFLETPWTSRNFPGLSGISPNFPRSSPTTFQDFNAWGMIKKGGVCKNSCRWASKCRMHNPPNMLYGGKGGNGGRHNNSPLLGALR